jgi:hypothetical protein
VDRSGFVAYIRDMSIPVAHESRSRFEAITTDWDFTAQSFMDQLPLTDQNRILVAVERLRESWPKFDPASVQRLPSPIRRKEYLLRVSRDLRVVFQPDDLTIRVVDVFRRSQLEEGRELQPHG